MADYVIRLVDVTMDVCRSIFDHGPDWRWEIEFPSRVRVTMWSGASADDVARYIERERRERASAQN